MIVKDIRYIIKRIIIGVGIALILMLIKGSLFLNVSALEIYAHDFGSQLDVISSTNYQTYYNTNNYWSDWGNGYVHFAFSVMKNAGQNSVTAIVQPRSVFVSTGGASFICDIGSVNSQNSTYNDQVYSATCPVSFDSGNGLRTIYINFSDIQANDPSTYRVTFDGKVTFEKPSAYPTFNDSGIINNQNSNNQALINNQNTNTQSIINNQNSNNQALINNQNANSQAQIESQKACISKVYSSNNYNSFVTQGYFNSTGDLLYSDKWRISNFLDIDSSSSYFSVSNGVSGTYTCFYESNSASSQISCFQVPTSGTYTYSIPSNAHYVRLSVRNENSPIYTIRYCSNGNQVLADQNQQLQNTLNDTNTDDAENQASNFFTDFTTDTHGLSGVITAPLSMLQALTTATCNPLVFQLPFTHDTVTLPCMKAILQDKFGVFFTLWQLITTGLISYNVCLNFYSKIRDLQNPNSDRIEVLNL